MKIDECEKCGGAIFLAGSDHVCDPGEVELKAVMDKATALVEAQQRVVEAAVKAREEMTLPLHLALAVDAYLELRES